MPPAAAVEGDLTQRVFRMADVGPSLPRPKDAVFICIDCEAFEHDQSKVTELGVAVLDTREIAGLDAGQHGEHWIAKMQYAHYRPVEYAQKVNRRFVQGAEDQFAFGNTTWINLRDASNILVRIFQRPEQLHDVANFTRHLTDSRRNIIFVAHGVSNDDEYLSKLGFQLKQAPNVVRQVDSQKVAGASKKRNIGLRRLLDILGIQHQGLHNGGNDAAYTLQALVVMAATGLQPATSDKAAEDPTVSLPGVLRASGTVAPHVYGGSAMAGTKLPVNGGKAEKRSARIVPKRKEVKANLENGGGTLSAASDNRGLKKRSAPADGHEDDDRVSKKPAR